MSSTGCVVQDAQTVIGHVPERGGLYYVDETTQQKAMLTRGSSDQHFWLWHWRLGHPFLAYLKHLFLSFKKHYDVS